MIIVTSPFCEIQHTTDGIYLLGDGASKTTNLDRKWRKNVDDDQTISPDSWMAFETYGVLATKTKGLIDYSYELYIDQSCLQVFLEVAEIGTAENFSNVLNSSITVYLEIYPKAIIIDNV